MDCLPCNMAPENHLWLNSSSHRKPFYIRSVKMLNRLLKSIRPPDEIHRLPHSLDDRKFWKATEYRNFLLIYPPVILVDVLPKRYYTHWLLLCNGIRLLLQDTVTGAMIITSRNCRHKFIAFIPDLYDGVHLSYNVHLLLLHLMLFITGDHCGHIQHLCMLVKLYFYRYEHKLSS